jgi:hypothetical protein
MREGHHHFEVGCVAVKRTAHFPAIRNARDILPAAGAAERAALIGWKGRAILVQEVDVLHCSSPVNVASVVRLVIGAAFQKGDRAERTRRSQATRQYQE